MTIRVNKESPIKLDAINKKIFYYLSADYRMPRNKLAKLIRISPQRLNHRINELERGLLEPYVCLNYPALGISSFLVLYDSLEPEEFKSLSDSGNIFYLLHLVGNHRYLAVVFTEDILEFSAKHTPSTIPEIFKLDGFFPDSWNGFDVTPLKQEKKTNKKIDLDLKDFKILSKLFEKPDISILDLSNNLKMSRQTLKERIKNLEDSNMIQKYRFSVNLPKAGLLDYFLHLRCRPAEVEKIRKYVQGNKYSGFLFQSNNDLFFSYITFTHEQLFSFFEELKKMFKLETNIYQNTGSYIVDTSPNYVGEFLKQRATKNL